MARRTSGGALRAHSSMALFCCCFLWPTLQLCKRESFLLSSPCSCPSAREVANLLGIIVLFFDVNHLRVHSLLSSKHHVGFHLFPIKSRSRWKKRRFGNRNLSFNCVSLCTSWLPSLRCPCNSDSSDFVRAAADCLCPSAQCPYVSQNFPSVLCGLLVPKPVCVAAQRVALVHHPSSVYGVG